MTPEALAAQEAEYEEGMPAFDAIAEGGRKLSRGLAKQRAMEKQEAQARAHLQHGQTDAALQKHTDAIKEQHRAANEQVQGLEQDFAGTGQEFAAADRERKGQRFDQARQLGIRAAAAYGNTGATAPTKEQADDIAADILRNMQDGLTAAQAANEAVLAKMRQIAQRQQQHTKAMQDMQMRAQRDNLGSDQGNFSMLPVMY